MLNIKEKWDIDSQLGQMLRDAESAAEEQKQDAFAERFAALKAEFEFGDDEVREIVASMRK